MHIATFKVCMRETISENYFLHHKYEISSKTKNVFSKLNLLRPLRFFLSTAWWHSKTNSPYHFEWPFTKLSFMLVVVSSPLFLCCLRSSKKKIFSDNSSANGKKCAVKAFCHFLLLLGCFYVHAMKMRGVFLIIFILSIRRAYSIND